MTNRFYINAPWHVLRGPVARAAACSRSLSGRLKSGLVLVLLGTILAGLPQRAGAIDNKPYDAKLLRLSEILGSIHYLRALCGANDGQMWRKQMQNILKTEGSSALRRAKLVKRFNKGYRGYRQTYRSCTDSAQVAVERFMKEGAEIADGLAARNR